MSFSIGFRRSRDRRHAVDGNLALEPSDFQFQHPGADPQRFCECTEFVVFFGFDRAIGTGHPEGGSMLAVISMLQQER